MNSREIRERFLKFFEKREHVVIPSASLVPDKSDTSVLFTTAGMQPLVPYLMGAPHPQGKRLVNIQKCVRTQDIDEVGDNTHDTFFEMMGNWSLGDYFKEDAVKWSYELLTSKEEGFGLDPERLYVTVFGGNDDAPKDVESFEIWKKHVPENRIYFMTWNGKKEPNWWDAGDNGPAGPDTEMFYDVTPDGLGDMTREEYIKADEEEKVVEIWNDVFMEYLKKDGKVIGKLSQKNVDTGAGLERLAVVLQGKDNIFDTDLFAPIMPVAGGRIVADHVRTSVFMIADGVTPSNTDRGYILRRLLRRAYVRNKNIIPVAEAVMEHPSYQGLYAFASNTKDIVREELGKFKKVLDAGLRQVEKGEDPFILFTSYGLPLDIIEEVAPVDREKFQKQMEEHKKLSSAAGEQKFKK